MKYTLYVDESGDFELNKGEWVIGSVLFEGAEEIVEKKLDSLKNILKDSGYPYEREKYHLTEFRRNFGNDKAIRIAENLLFLSLSKVNLKYKFLTVINENKVSLSQKERTYRTMLRDLISLIDSSLSYGDRIDNLDIIIATRTIDGERQTTISDICSDILGYMPKETEYDLASLGIVDLINSKRLNVKLDQANKSWGLVCADFISNLSHNKKQKESKLLLDKLFVNARLQTFDGIGSYKERRAKIAAANGDYKLACERWISIAVENSNDKDTFSICSKEISKLIQLIIFEGGSSYGIYSILAIEESLWRVFRDYDKRIEALELLESVICNLDKDIVLKVSTPLFKLRNLLLVSLNHIGDTQRALRLEKLQVEICQQHSFDPDIFNMILDFKRIQSEIYVNLLDFENAFLYVNEYHQLVDTYSQVWALMSNCENENFKQSNVWKKCESNYLRVVALLGLEKSGESIESYNDKFLNLKTLELSSPELSRLDNMWTVVLLKSGKIKTALEFQQSRQLSIEKASIFDIYTELLCYYYYLRNNTLIGDFLYDDRIKGIETRLTSDRSINEKQHPAESAYLLLAIIAWYKNDIKKAKDLISKANKCFNLNKNSKIAVSILNSISIAGSVIFSKEISSDVDLSILVNDKENLDKNELLNRSIGQTIGL